MQHDPDYHMAILLQQQFNTEVNIENPSEDLVYYKKKKNNQKSLTDPSWELVDPTPNIFNLFVQFNNRFFWDKLGSVAVSWSKRMTTCAGICSYQGRGGLCHITLSEPLLKLRPRKDLVETLLHEMIHAFLFVTHNNKDRDGHGPEFHKHMYRINGEAGTNITVYHNFHDEVRLYKQHWWRCDGPCQKRPPYFGMVRRAMNRAPGPYDRWWAEHKHNCGGNFIKVKEPEKKNANSNKVNKNKKLNSPSKSSPTKTNLPDIRNFLPVVKDINTSNKENIQTINSSQSKTVFGTKNKNRTVVLNSKTTAKENNLPITSVIPSSSNIVGFSKDAELTRKNIEVFSGPGNKLGEPSNTKSIPDNYNLVRNHWANKFSNPSTSQNTNIKRKSDSSDNEANKKIKNNETYAVTCPNCNKYFVDSEINAHLDTCLNADDSIKSEFSNESFTMVECPVCKTVMEEDSLNNHLDECLSKNDNDKSDEKHCEICDTNIPSNEYTPHVQDCLNKFYDNIEQKLQTKTISSPETTLCLVCNKNIIKDLLNQHLEDCMGTVFDKEHFKIQDDDKNDDSDSNDCEELNTTIYNCPICMSVIDESDMNNHIDECLNADAIKDEFV